MKLTKNTVSQKNVTIVRLFVLLFLSNTAVFGQTKEEVFSTITSTEVSITKNFTIVLSNENTIVSTSMDFAVWFAGTKNTSSNYKSNGSFSKKQLINSGVNTNSVLIRSILKKVSYQGNSIA